MTIPDALAHIRIQVTGWHTDRLTALREGDAERAHDCQVRIDALEQLARDLEEKEAA